VRSGHRAAELARDGETNVERIGLCLFGRRYEI
jgi:hypothetical protein